MVKRAALLASESQDFSVLEGLRTLARQKALYAKGRTTKGPKVTWTLNSRHLPNPKTGWGEAIDLIPYPLDWEDLSKFDAIASLMFKAADIEKVRIRWGADWDKDGKPRERGETDSPHFELAK